MNAAAKSGSRNHLLKVAEHFEVLSSTYAALSEEARSLLDAPKGGKGGKKRKAKAAPKRMVRPRRPTVTFCGRRSTLSRTRMNSPS